MLMHLFMALLNANSFELEVDGEVVRVIAKIAGLDFLIHADKVTLCDPQGREHDFALDDPMLIKNLVFWHELHHITVYKPIAGWKAIHYWFNKEEPGLGTFVEPYQTGMFAFATEDEAIRDAKRWAEADGLFFVHPRAGKAIEMHKNDMV